jgi:hypothetical protein
MKALIFLLERISFSEYVTKCNGQLFLIEVWQETLDLHLEEINTKKERICEKLIDTTLKCVQPIAARFPFRL